MAHSAAGKRLVHRQSPKREVRSEVCEPQR